ncbi:MAG: hypothetical protein EON60_04495 [Alphaproteobacteria bacterium]|nr:MAG: hypothetical protein EON60_04495 [Alphaproteobacteria bacterium]
MSDILYPNTADELNHALCHVLEDFSTSTYQGKPLSACLSPGIYTTPDVVNNVHKRAVFQTRLEEQLSCPGHRLEVNWHTESVSNMRQWAMQLPHHLLCQSKLMRPSILIRPPSIHQ